MTDELISHSLSQSLSDKKFKPTDLHLDRKEGLRIPWADGHVSHYPLDYLRKQCPCATCRNERETPPSRTTSRSLTILPANISQAVEFVNAKLVGNYAINIIWGDGHSTGIYDFRYLRMICPSEDAGGASNPDG